LCRGSERLVRYGPLVQADIQDLQSLQQAIETYQPVGMLHFAAYAYVAESVQDPLIYFENNVVGSLGILRVLAKKQCKIPLVFSSSCAVYGNACELPLSESSQANPINPYGRSKMMVEQMLLACSRAYGQRSVALRYFNAAGSDPDGVIGEIHDPEPHLIPLVLRTALGKQAYLEINGDDWDTKDGSCVRDYVHVCDLASAHVKALEAMLAGRSLQPAYNLGSGCGFSVKQVVQVCENVTARTIATRIVPRREGDPAQLYASSALAARDLNWQPAFPHLQTMVEHAWNWLRNIA
jgi:UDP-arabinose 4-epimerase